MHVCVCLFPGLQDYEAALKLDPNNNLLRDDAQRIRDVIQSSSGAGDE